MENQFNGHQIWGGLRASIPAMIMLVSAIAYQIRADSERDAHISSLEINYNRLEHRIDLLDQIHEKIILLGSDIKRLDSQQDRIIQALDSTYNTLQEALRNGQITRKPPPTTHQPYE